MVSKKISDACYPIKVKMGKNMKNGNLVLNVVHGKELEVEYEKQEIIEKINSFFGYNCISHVTLKIVENSIKNNKKVFPKIKNLSRNSSENNSFNTKRESYLQTLEQVKVDYPKYFDIAKTIVKRAGGQTGRSVAPTHTLM